MAPPPPAGLQSGPTHPFLTSSPSLSLNQPLYPGCAGSLRLHMSSSSCGKQGPLSSCAAGAQLLAPRHMGSSQVRGRTHVLSSPPVL